MSQIKEKNLLFFSSFRGVKQGENLLSVLFVLFLNDLESFLSNKSCNAVNVEFQYDDITLYLKLLVLLYADNTVVFGTDEDFQNNLNMFYKYSELLHLTTCINFDKTKIMIFGTKQDQRLDFNLGGNKIDIRIDFDYLGVIFSRNRHFHQIKKHNIEQTRKAVHVLLNEFGILIGTKANTIQYKVTNDRFLVINLFMEKNPNHQNCRIMLKEQEKGLYDFKLVRCINGILVSAGQPDLFKTDSVKN